MTISSNSRAEIPLPWCREHCGERVGDAGTGRGLITEGRQVVVHQLGVVGEDAENAAHLLDGRVVDPDRIETRGKRELDADAAHQSEPADPVLMIGREGQRHAAAESARLGTAD